MAMAESTSFYKSQDDIYFNDGREEELLEFVQSQLQDADRAAPASILRLIDEYGRQHQYLMNIGSEKGHLVTELIAQCKPETVLEFGSYIGYSTILFASALKDCGGRQLISIEQEPRFAHVAKSLVRLAGLSDMVRFVVGPSSEVTMAEHAAGRLQRADLIFFDHFKPAYIKDLKICESLGLIQDRTLLVADNVIKPGNPPYLEYVRASVSEKRKRFEEATAHVRASNGGTELPGVPDLIYESRLMSGMEPSGVPDAIEVTVCRGKAALLASR